MTKDMHSDNNESRIATVRERIKSVLELAEISTAAKAKGKTVVLAHGAFDLLHLGHVRHLEQARALGDVLIVTVTADEFINKGPNRPVFPEELRAEMLAALEYVDWTGVNREATAEKLLAAVRPSIYVKGSDYADPDDDPTGKIADERAIVEGYGGKLVITKDIMFSSSELINEHLLSRPPEVQRFLNKLRDERRTDSMLELIDRASTVKALFVGETILDEYLYVSPLGKTSKDSIIATQYREREIFAGGVIAAANHAASICKEVEIVTCLGGADDYEAFVRSKLKPNVSLTVIKLENRPTVRKRRYVDVDSKSIGMLRKLFEVAHIDDRPPDKSEKRAIEETIRAKAEGMDLVVVCDFGHGMIEGATVDTLRARAKFLAVNSQANSANMGFNLITKYPNADYVCVDEREARLVVGDKHAAIEMILDEKLASALDCNLIFVTRGSIGSLCWSRGVGTILVPALGHKPRDTMGAGDAFLAVTAPLLALGGGVAEVGFIGNVAGGMKTNVIGHRTGIEKSELKKSIIGLLK